MNKPKKQIGYKFVAYPICIILALALFLITFFVVIPVINHYAVVTYGDSMEQLLVYYPVFLCFDFLTAGGAIWLIFSLINAITGFCKKHIKKKE